MSDMNYNQNNFQRGEEPIPDNRIKTVDFGGFNEKKGGGVPVAAMIAIVLVAVLVTFMTTYVLTASKPAGGDAEGIPEEAYEKLSQISEVLDEYYLYDIDEDLLSAYILKGYMYGIGDNYAEYFTKEEFDALMSDTNAEMVGIGISVASDGNDGILIISVFPDSPAQKAGVMPGDVVTHIMADGEMTAVSSLGFTVASNHMRGEAGTKCEFIVARGEDLSESVEFSIERGKITEYTVTHRVHTLDKKIGVIAISSFDKETPNQFKKAYDELLAAGCEKLVIDVRNNPGGELISVCTTLDMLVPEGPVIRTVDKAGNETVEYTSDKNESNVPMAVLVNGNTASAGELFAACLKDYEKAVLVGETTFGKGSMQTTMSFSDGTAFKYTFRYYCPPFSDNYDGVGIKPDVKAELSKEALSHFYTLTDAEDTQLQAAVEELNK